MSEIVVESIVNLKEGTPIDAHMVKTNHTNRTFGDYLDDLGLQIPLMIGERVLDIGSGTHRQFTRMAIKYGIDAVALDPLLPEQRLESDVFAKDFQRYLEQARDEVRQGALVHAPVQEMPFDDESFDRVVSLFAVPYWLPREGYDEHVFRAFAEVLRVLKPGGRGHFYPTNQSRVERPTNLGGYVPPEVVDWLGRAGCNAPFTSNPYERKDVASTKGWERLIIRKAV